MQPRISPRSQSNTKLNCGILPFSDTCLYKGYICCISHTHPDQLCPEFNKFVRIRNHCRHSKHLATVRLQCSWSQVSLFLSDNSRNFRSKPVHSKAIIHMMMPKRLFIWWCHRLIEFGAWLSNDQTHLSTVKPVYNDHLMGYFSAFWSSSRWPNLTAIDRFHCTKMCLVITQPCPEFN